MACRRYWTCYDIKVDLDAVEGREVDGEGGPLCCTRVVDNGLKREVLGAGVLDIWQHKFI